jgi:hypothetical protein
MSIVGHKPESIYRRYAIVDEAMQREAAALLDAWVPPQPSTTTATVTAFRTGTGSERDQSGITGRAAPRRGPARS